jgi:ABC-type glycerol-3-phosphate transport system substrate-binding protein
MLDDANQPSDASTASSSRRAFIAAVGVSTGVAGLSVPVDAAETGENGPNVRSVLGSATQNRATVRIAASTPVEDNWDGIVESLRTRGGLPDDIDLRIDSSPFRARNPRSTFSRWLASGRTTPTVLMMDSGWTAPFVSRGYLESLDGLVSEETVTRITDQYFTAALSTVTGRDGGLYGLPLFVDLPTVQYRKDILRRAGYGDSDFETWATEPMTWREFGRIIGTGMDESGLDGFLWQGAAYEGLACCTFNEFISSWGGAYFGGFDNLFGPIAERPITVDEQPVVDALSMMRTFVHGPSAPATLDGYGNISPRSVVGYTEEPSRRAFTDGEAIALRNWPYSIGINASERVFGEDLGVMPLPYQVSEEESKYGPRIGGTSAALGGWNFTINVHAAPEEKRVAARLFEAIQTGPVQRDLLDILSWVPPTPIVISSSYFKESGPIGRYVSPLLIAGENAIPRPGTRIWPQQSREIAERVNAALRGEVEPARALTELERRLREIETSIVTPTSTPTPSPTPSPARTSPTETSPTETSLPTGTPGRTQDPGTSNDATTGDGTGFGSLVALGGLGTVVWRRLQSS